ncbi:MAG TPA: DUF934 domain-containing protein [Alphaproteobacteria bacterium]|jgi:uncharacterized protein (DUF934 family)|uniref:DUF934 domain-containing protein n=1 Tax=Alcanivorax profundi TaxID=2338368 RepID=A0A418Y3K5_9GAMM|nr:MULTISPECIES: DUF934 domain-containing protein [Alcanivorax]MAX54316.1 DUF934 domain-containing protein [Alcanivoracaceae bacterium]MCG8436712.1 DUF934 domain-containing protein [Pseudomonadales bacterium]MEE2869362.1 DUF934 domain-containing protein [Pseudomonadota bacterium]HAD24405.1 DUF934 domain-containing protein [Alphaproteobacteria bacterium]ERP86561.1 oxidoreductase [Alcanivorax sp. P2S70]|tara:strand:+ start:1345 stop:1833 length:489 start_codon:yes stop_codon:yes gene_type:complete
MGKVIIDGAIVDNEWARLEADALEAGLPDGKVIVPLAYWQENRDTLMTRGDVAVWLAPGEEPKDLADDLSALSLVAIHFPAFKDGRGYSYARELRTRFAFKGEVRATGDVLRDQLFYLARCGFNAFEVREDRSIEEAVASLKDFTVRYQGDVNDPRPIYRQA